MNQTLTKFEIENIVWRACDTFRGAIDPSEYKNYILTMLFVKYLSDLAKEKRAQYSQRYGGDTQRIDRAMSRERFVIPAESDFDYLYSKRESANLGELINTALQNIEDENKGKLENVFRNIDFNSEPALGQTRDRNRRLKNLLDDFAQLDLQPSHLEDRDVIGDVYEYLIGRFAAGAGKKAGDFYTPPQVSTLLAKLLNAQPGDKICDPACGSGSLLIKVAKEIGSDNFSLAGQESNGSTWALCKMNMFLHGMDSARIEWCDTINNPQLVQDRSLIKYDIVVANPPFSLDKWGIEAAETDKFQRFKRGVPPRSRGDYAFISHMVEATFESSGKVAVIVPNGVLFRGGSEGKIRQKLIQENLLHAVVGLPPNLFYGTGIPAAVLLFSRNKKTTDVLFIDASHEYEDGTNQNHLRSRDIDKIASVFARFETVHRYSHRATLEEIKENEFNLSIPRYVDTFEPEPEINIQSVLDDINAIEKQLESTRVSLDSQLRELGFKTGEIGSHGD
jgi:type I restriction enzyme M protein